MMDGQVAAIRDGLEETGLSEVAILAYAAKHASAFYGPFREAADSAPAFGDRRSYQMDAANGREALAEVLADVEEGADMVMVKPALPALDLVAATRAAVSVPVAAYQVSGEYAAICAAAERGWLDRRATALESLTAIGRAGAGIIVTYFAREAAAWFRDDAR
jgi:porphobilinogen synthase